MDCLETLVKDIFMPQLMYSDNGYILLNSTPSDTPGHPFTISCEEAEIGGYYATKTIYDNPLLSVDEILEFAEEAGCEVNWDRFHELRKGFEDLPKYREDLVNQVITKTSTTWRREYLAEFVTEESSAIIPEMTRNKEIQIVQPWKTPEMYNTFTIGDLGFKDATAILFGYYDFHNAKTIIQDELICHAPSSREIADGIRKKEQELWGDKEPYGRWMDGDLIVLQDISIEHGLTCAPVGKDALEAMVNNVRLEVQRNNVIIDPRCKTTIAHLKYGIWDKQRKKFARSGQFYHFDALAALVYFLRHVSKEANPYPPDYKLATSTHFIPEGTLVTDQARQWGKVIGS